MTLKESFRMQNYLNTLIHDASMFLYDKRNIMQSQENHMRKASNPNAVDEIVNTPKPSEIKAAQVISMLEKLITEKEVLTQAINVAKKNAEIDIDEAIAINKTKQSVISCLEKLANQKSSETITKGTGYLINNDGNQSAYNYDIKTVNTIDYDRNEVKAIIRRLRKECDETSAKIDLLNATLEVFYEPRYEIGISFEDACAI